VPKNVQIRNLDDATYEKLRARAAADGVSLSQYLRRELDHLAGLATMAEILERANRRHAAGGGVSTEAIVEALHAGRAERL
jgi:plasmid stability protein